MMLLPPTVKHMDLESRKMGKIAIYFFMSENLFNSRHREMGNGLAHTRALRSGHAASWHLNAEDRMTWAFGHWKSLR